MGENNEELPIPIGTNKSEFFMFDKERSFTTKYLVHNDKQWEFEIYDDISVKEMNDCIRALYDIDDKVQNQNQDISQVLQKQNYEKYLRRLMRYFIKSAPFDHTSEKELIDIQSKSAKLSYEIKFLFPYDPMNMALEDNVKKKLKEYAGLDV